MSNHIYSDDPSKPCNNTLNSDSPCVVCLATFRDEILRLLQWAGEQPAGTFTGEWSNKTINDLWEKK